MNGLTVAAQLFILILGPSGSSSLSAEDYTDLSNRLRPQRLTAIRYRELRQEDRPPGARVRVPCFHLVVCNTVRSSCSRELGMFNYRVVRPAPFLFSALLRLTFPMANPWI